MKTLIIIIKVLNLDDNQGSEFRQGRQIIIKLQNFDNDISLSSSQSFAGAFISDLNGSRDSVRLPQVTRTSSNSMKTVCNVIKEIGIF